jgi:vanillate/3-O-methylgallate O-demethylase
VLTGSPWRDTRFSRWRKAELLDEEVIVARRGVTGEVGYELFMPTASGRAHELWRTIREVGSDYGLREMGFKAQLIGHIEAGIATVVRDYLPDRMAAESLPRFARMWMTEEELGALDWDLSEQLCSPAARPPAGFEPAANGLERCRMDRFADIPHEGWLADTRRGHL